MKSTEIKWSKDDLCKALQDIHDKKLSLRSAAAAYGIPKSTLFDYASGRVQIGSKQGPPTVLTAAEESKLVEYAVHMARIGYGRSKEQICLAVQKILETEGRPNTFKDNKPGRKWWTLFKRRNPNICLRTPMHLQLCRVHSCTPEAISQWFQDFNQFLQTHNLKNQPARIWNADETGVSLCPKTGKVIALKSSRHVYGVTGNTKEQITVLCAANAAGDTVPPMHVFPGERFRSNPMSGCIDGAYFGRSSNGWMTTELFYGWLANHFAKFVPQRPVVLLVDGHSTHIDLEISKLCRDLQIHLYCLPPLASHILQPLDVGFFGSLKFSWGKCFKEYKFQNPGIPLTKYTFAPIFKAAWINCIKLSTFVNSFKESGICPFNPKAISSERLAPSLTVSQPKVVPESSFSTLTHEEIEKMMKLETVELYNKRFEEGFDIEEDELYAIWVNLKKLSISKQPSNPLPHATDKEPDFNNMLPEKQQMVSPVFDEVLTYPETKSSSGRGTRGKATGCLPKHLSSDQVISHLAKKQEEKQKAEEEKLERKIARELKKKQLEEEKTRRRMEREKKRRTAQMLKDSQTTGRGRGTRKGQGAREGRRNGHQEPGRRYESFSSGEDCDSSNIKSKRLGPLKAGYAHGRLNKSKQQAADNVSDDVSEKDSDTSSTIHCPVCGLPEIQNGSDGAWIACDICDQWYHINCIDLDPECNLDDVDWACYNCD